MKESISYDSIPFSKRKVLPSLFYIIFIKKWKVKKIRSFFTFHLLFPLSGNYLIYLFLFVELMRFDHQFGF